MLDTLLFAYWKVYYHQEVKMSPSNVAAIDLRSLHVYPFPKRVLNLPLYNTVDP